MSGTNTEQVLFGAGICYQKNSVPDCMTPGMLILGIGLEAKFSSLGLEFVTLALNAVHKSQDHLPWYINNAILNCESALIVIIIMLL